MCQDVVIASPSKAPCIFLLSCLSWAEFGVFSPRVVEKGNSNVLAHFSSIRVLTVLSEGKLDYGGIGKEAHVMSL